VILKCEDQEYLLSRGYTEESIAEEQIFSTREGKHSWGDHEIYLDEPGILWVVRSASGKVIGTQYRSSQSSTYRWMQNDGAAHLPLLYGTKGDHQIFFDEGAAILVEGIFDRIVLKRAVPDYAVFARLSKGVARQSIQYLTRHGKFIVLAFDSDAPGRKATEDAKKMLKDKMDLGELRFPAKDPSKCWTKVGEGAFQKGVQKQLAQFDWMFV